MDPQRRGRYPHALCLVKAFYGHSSGAPFAPNGGGRKSQGALGGSIDGAMWEGV